MSLLAWYPLIANGNNQGLDGIDLTPIGTITYTAGKLGNAPTFTQNLANRFRRPQIKINDNFSFACWFKLETTESTTWQTLLFEGRDVNSDGWGFRINGSNKRLIYCCGSSAWTYGTDLTMCQWYHATMVVKDGVYTAYLNGTQINTATITTLPALTEWGTYFYISCLSDGYYPLMGQVQDVRIYDHPLSKKEVKEISKGLTIHLPMDWGSGKPNMIKNSYTWMNKATGSNNANSCTITKSVIEDNTAPCFNVLKCTITNSAETAKGSTGIYYAIAAQGLALTDLIEGETYTYSFWAKSDSGIASGLRYDAIIESQTHVSSNGFGTLDSNWKKHTVTFKWTKTTKLTACFYVTVPASSTVDFQLCGIKLEKGDTATPYIPHVNETVYTSRGYANNYKDECSGYNRGITNGGTAVIGEESPRGTGTYCTSGCYLQATSGFPLSSAMPSWTVALWFKPDIGKTFTSWSDVFRFWMNTEAGNNTHFRLETQNSSGNNYSLYYNNSGQSAYGGGALTTITENKWYHLAFCCDSTKIYQYVNSELKITHTINTGYKPTGPTGYFQIGDGGMYASYADVRVYATCLSADDIKELYQIPVQIDKTGKIYCNNLVEA